MAPWHPPPPARAVDTRVSRGALCLWHWRRPDGGRKRVWYCFPAWDIQTIPAALGEYWRRGLRRLGLHFVSFPFSSLLLSPFAFLPSYPPSSSPFFPSFLTLSFSLSIFAISFYLPFFLTLTLSPILLISLSHSHSLSLPLPFLWFLWNSHSHSHSRFNPHFRPSPLSPLPFSLYPFLLFILPLRLPFLPSCLTSTANSFNFFHPSPCLALACFAGDTQRMEFVFSPNLLYFIFPFHHSFLSYNFACLWFIRKNTQRSQNLAS